MTKQPIDFDNINELENYLIVKKIECNDEIVNLLKRYGVCETINPIKKLKSKSLDLNWNHVYVDEISSEFVINSYQSSKRFNQELFKAIDEFERLFSHQIINIYVMNNGKLSDIIDENTQKKLLDSNNKKYIEEFIDILSNLNDTEVYTNHIYSFFNSNVASNDSSLKKKITLC